ncbi:small multi-drug export protein [Streptomyces sp. ST2-7A]|uniref:small multi-drug export protein n=1 Tax=Streptomyces sp. ST2-7A TaxID=2907214 RepID=UPI001F2B9C17|nr:small multi-drug export protein [Streptomyces sp. ST2-7A]
MIGVFLGGALPWLEAIIVIPAGIVAGLNPVAVTVAGLTGNLLTVALTAWYGERLRRWWLERRARKVSSAPAAEGEPAPAPTSDRAAARRERIRRILNRWGMPGLAVLGPLGIGTQLSAAVAVSMGVTARRATVWVGTATLVWGILAAGLALGGMDLFAS